jgi:hypothetical protein
VANDNPDPFDLQALREAPILVKVKPRRLHIPVRRRPNRHDFVRTHSDPEYRINLPIFRGGSDGDDEEMYYVVPAMMAEMPNEVQLYTAFTAVNLRGSVFLWCIPIPPDDRQPNAWLVTNRECAETAIDKWVRVASNRDDGCYHAVDYEGPPVEPVFPQETFRELLMLGFKNRVVDRPDHPIILKLRGLA